MTERNPEGNTGQQRGSGGGFGLRFMACVLTMGSGLFNGPGAQHGTATGIIILCHQSK